MSTEVKNNAIEQLTQQLKSLEVTDLFKVLKAGLVEAEKKSKSKVVKKVGSMPKGSCPPQLKLNNAWVKHVKDYVNQNGWEAFMVPTTVTDKVTQVKKIVMEDLPGSILHNGIHIFEGSVTEKTPMGIQVSHKQAMTLSKQWKEGENAHLYTEFAESFNPEDESSDTDSIMEVESVVSDEMEVVHTTMSEKLAAKAAKEAEKEAAKAQKEQEKATAKMAKEEAKAQKEQEKMEKAAAAAELKAQKALEAEAAKAEKARAASISNTLKMQSVPKAAVKVTKPAAKVIKPAAKPAAKPADKPVTKPVVAWSCEDDGNFKKWVHNGVIYVRNFEGQVWNIDNNGDLTTWAGIYLPAEDRIDETAEEPIFDEDM